MMVTASLLATSMAMGACGGDDDGGGGEEDPREDAGNGGGGNDASVDAARPDAAGPDASNPGGDAGADAGNALLEAADPTGVNVAMSRVTLLFTESCQRAKDCKDELYTDTCVGETLAAYQVGVEGNYPVACLDALLDRIGCYATVSNCDDYFSGDTCLALENAYNTACAEFMGEDDAGT